MPPCGDHTLSQHGATAAAGEAEATVVHADPASNVPDGSDGDSASDWSSEEPPRLPKGPEYSAEQWAALTAEQREAITRLRAGDFDAHTAPFVARWESHLHLCLRLGTDVAAVGGPPAGSYRRAAVRKRSAPICSGPHGPVNLVQVLSAEDIAGLHDVWERYHHDMYREDGETLPDASRPRLREHDARVVYRAADQVCAEMERHHRAHCGGSLVLDHVTISATNDVGHRRHADNEIFTIHRVPRGTPCTGCQGRPLRDCRKCLLPYCRGCGPKHDCEGEIQPPDAVAQGATVTWSPGKTRYRNYACSVALSDPGSYEGGDIAFWDHMGSPEPRLECRSALGDGVMFCGCRKSLHSVRGVTSGFRLQLLLWTRPADVRAQGTVHALHRPGTGPAVWLTSPELESLAHGTYQNIECAAPEARGALRALQALSWHRGGPVGIARVCAEVLTRSVGHSAAARLLRAAAAELDTAAALPAAGRPVRDAAADEQEQQQQQPSV
eukprot:TRINITY_DN5115_c0_g1_i1.p1 TRINITY_DN5115_c0_g1~~TRINITY_DN5115_c0_g1_i1.p1  ORF type:complete len:520 (+),score=105.62 TRINITY_DN5115_c0_g1_i1:71-1561(+)